MLITFEEKCCGFNHPVTISQKFSKSLYIEGIPYFCNEPSNCLSLVCFYLKIKMQAKKILTVF